MADSEFVLSQEGLMFVARFEGVDRGTRNDRDFSEIRVSLRRYDGTRYERTFMFDDVDYDSGARTELSVALNDVLVGEQIMLRLDVNVSTRTNKAWYKVNAVQILAPVRPTVPGPGSAPQAPSFADSPVNGKVGAVK